MIRSTNLQSVGKERKASLIAGLLYISRYMVKQTKVISKSYSKPLIYNVK
ncbi:hypothetical protein JOE23_002611 [Amphibacillus cookii]|nr:hypothetical protein [Amphibacillus cookii]